jgi:hypothetical protein
MVVLEDTVAVTTGVTLLGENQLAVPTAQTIRTSLA